MYWEERRSNYAAVMLAGLRYSSTNVISSLYLTYFKCSHYKKNFFWIYFDLITFLLNISRYTWHQIYEFPNDWEPCLNPCLCIHSLVGGWVSGWMDGWKREAGDGIKKSRERVRRISGNKNSASHKYYPWVSWLGVTLQKCHCCSFRSFNVFIQGEENTMVMAFYFLYSLKPTVNYYWVRKNDYFFY